MGIINWLKSHSRIIKEILDIIMLFLVATSAVIIYIQYERLVTKCKDIKPDEVGVDKSFEYFKNKFSEEVKLTVGPEKVRVAGNIAGSGYEKFEFKITVNGFLNNRDFIEIENLKKGQSVSGCSITDIIKISNTMFLIKCTNRVKNLYKINIRAKLTTKPIYPFAITEADKYNTTYIKFYKFLQDSNILKINNQDTIFVRDQSILETVLEVDAK